MIFFSFQPDQRSTRLADPQKMERFSGGNSGSATRLEKRFDVKRNGFKTHLIKYYADFSIWLK